MRAETFLICFIIFDIAWMIFVFIRNAKKRDIHQKENAYYDINQKQYYRGVDARTIETAKDALYQLESGYQAIKEHVTPVSASCYEADIREVRSNIDGLVLEKWQNKADKILAEFIRLYLLITNPSFADIEQAHRSKNKCLSRYDAYWEWTRKIHEENVSCLDCLNIWVEAKSYFKFQFEGMTESGDHEMLVWGESGSFSTRQRIEKRLDDCIYAMQPEYKRKIRLRDLILSHIREQETVQRSVLLRMDYTGFIEGEIRTCYNSLLKERLIIEVKQGSRYFVSLTERGNKPVIRAKPPPAEPSDDDEQLVAEAKEETAMIDSREKLMHDAIVNHFADEGIEYIDKTEKGGGLYFFDEQAAKELQNKGYAVRFAENGTKGTNHRAAWYINIKE